MNSVPFSQSLRLRLPLLISGLIVIVLGSFLWTVNRLVEQTLLRAGAVRAQAAADQVAALMATAASRGVNELRRLAASDDVRRYAQSPSPDQEAAIRRLLLPLAVANQPPVVLTNRSGDRMLEIPPPSGGRVAPSVATAERIAGAAGLGELRNADGIVFYDVVADIPERTGADGAQPPAPGSIVVRRILSAAQTTDTINRLVGGGAVVGIGNQRGDVWSTFSKPLPAPPIDAAHSGVSEYTRPDGDRRIGAASIIGGTPWTVWVELSRQTILLPARTVLTRMLLLALAFVIAAAMAVAVITTRITKPLHELTVASSAIAAGEFSRRVQQAGRRDEIGRLGAAFNTMTTYVDRDHQELERRVRERTQSLQAAMDELEAFSYSVSHDLRAPLRHIAGFAALLDQSTARLDEEGRHYVATIAGAATRMGQLIDDLLAFSRVGRSAMAVRRVDVSELVREVRNEAGAGPNVVWRIGELPIVAGDPALLRLVLVNLVSNAVKYSSKRDRPEIEIGTRAERDEQRPVIFIRDNGVGFDMTYAHKLFGVFSRLHSVDEFEGTGIGLANVRRIVARHGGRAWAESEVGRGATFYVSLPPSGKPDEVTAA